MFKSLFNNKEKSVEKFARLIGKMEGKEFVALAQRMGVRIFYDTSDGVEKPIPRSPQSILEDSLVKFYTLDRKTRRLIIKAIEASIKRGKNGN